jgi:hypothetical protein
MRSRINVENKKGIHVMKGSQSDMEAGGSKRFETTLSLLSLLSHKYCDCVPFNIVVV